MKHPSEATFARIDAAIREVREGSRVRTAADASGIAVTVLYAWLRLSRAGEAPAWIYQQWVDAVNSGGGCVARACAVSRVVALVEGGEDPVLAAKQHGMGITTIRRWMRRSRAGIAPASLAVRWDAAMRLRAMKRGAAEPCDFCGDQCDGDTACSVACCDGGVSFPLYFCTVECRDAFVGCEGGE